MKSLVGTLLGVGMALLLSYPVCAQEQELGEEDPIHQELRELRSGLIGAVQANDLDKLLGYLQEDVVVTWLDGEQSRGQDQVRGYYRRMMEGEERVVDSYSVDNVEVKELTILYGDDAGVAYGTATSHFDLMDGTTFTVQGPWTATVVRDGQQWRIAAFHSSASMFDNPILDIATRWIYRAGIVAGVVGLIAGMLIVGVIKRRRAAPEAA